MSTGGIDKSSHQSSVDVVQERSERPVEQEESGQAAIGRYKSRKVTVPENLERLLVGKRVAGSANPAPKATRKALHKRLIKRIRNYDFRNLSVDLTKLLRRQKLTQQSQQTQQAQQPTEQPSSARKLSMDLAREAAQSRKGSPVKPAVTPRKKPPVPPKPERLKQGQTTQQPDKTASKKLNPTQPEAGVAVKKQVTGAATPSVASAASDPATRKTPQWQLDLKANIFFLEQCDARLSFNSNSSTWNAITDLLQKNQELSASSKISGAEHARIVDKALKRILKNYRAKLEGKYNIPVAELLAQAEEIRNRQ